MNSLCGLAVSFEDCPGQPFSREWPVPLTRTPEYYSRHGRDKRFLGHSLSDSSETSKSRKRGTGRGEKGTLLHKVIDIADVRYCSDVDRTRGCHDTLYYWVPVDGVNCSCEAFVSTGVSQIRDVRCARHTRPIKSRWGTGALMCSCSRRTLRQAQDERRAQDTNTSKRVSRTACI